MKKLAILVASLALLLSGCGASEPAKTEEELRAEVKAELEAEMAAGAAETETSGESADIKDQEALMSFLMKEKNIESAYSENEVKEMLNFVYGDFNSDGKEDVICYAEANNVFNGIEIVVIKDGAYTLLESPIRDFHAYTKAVAIEGDFVKVTYTSGGTGLSVTTVSIYAVDESGLVDTGLHLVTQYEEGQPPTADYPDGYVRNAIGTIEDRSYKVATDDDKWLQVYYTYLLKDGLDDSVILETKDMYYYNEDTKTFDYEQFDTPTVNKAAYGEASPGANGKYDVKDLMPGQLLEGMLLKNAVYSNWSGAGFDLALNKTLKGEIIYEETFGEYLFEADDKILSKPVVIATPDGQQSWDSYGPEYATLSNDFLKKLTAAEKKYLDDNKKIDVEINVTLFSKFIAFESEGGESIAYDSFKVLTKLSDSGESSSKTDTATADSTVMDPKSLTRGQKLGGFTLDWISYNPGKTIEFEMSGSKSVTGYFEYSEHNGGLLFVSADKWLDKPIVYTFNSGYTNRVETLSGYVNEMRSDSLDMQTMNYLSEGNRLKARVTIFEYGVHDQDYTEGYTSVSFKDLEIQPDENYIVYVEANNGKKVANLSTDTFATYNSGNVTVDYDRYRCVIIPMYTSVNESKLEFQSAYFGEGVEMKFTVIGEVQDVKLNYVTGPGEEGEWVDLGKISNGVVTVSANLPSDMSAVIVHGRFHDGEGYYRDFQFSLDDMRDIGAYDLILYE